MSFLDTSRTGGKRLLYEEEGRVKFDSLNDSGPAKKRKDFDSEKMPNHIILITIMNAAYPINVEVIHAITSKHGQVQRIVVFRKNGVQSMVEFDSVESATRAKDALQGADIYTGCCTLRIEFAKPERLNVQRNNQDSWDYTLGQPDQKPSQGLLPKQPLLEEPRFGRMPMMYRNQNSGNSPLYGNAPLSDRFGLNGSIGSFASEMAFRPSPPPGARGASANGGGSLLMSQGVGAHGGPQQRSVVMVYGLNKDNMNADKVFNLFCLYGNVARVKFLKTKEGCAMVQMGDALAAERAINHLNNVTFFGSKMTLSHSKQAYLNDVQQPYELSDGTPSFKDYIGSKNNRFLNANSANKNRIQGPTPMVHFYNMPPGICQDELVDIFAEADVNCPIATKVFPAKSERSSSGLLEFNSISESLEALVACNHKRVSHNSSKYPFTMRLCFSAARLGLETGGSSANDTTMDE